jgi:hypothetical protein
LVHVRIRAMNHLPGDSLLHPPNQTPHHHLFPNPSTLARFRSSSDPSIVHLATREQDHSSRSLVGIFVMTIRCRRLVERWRVFEVRVSGN